MKTSINGFTSKIQAIRAINVKLEKHGIVLKSVLGQKNANSKLKKSNIKTYPLNLMPADSSGIMNTCPWATKQCKDLCLHTAGNPAWQVNKNSGRTARTYAFKFARAEFMAALAFDIMNKIKNSDDTVAFRLNTTSDIPWEKQTINVDGKDVFLMEYFKDASFYDYTKGYDRMSNFLDKNLPSNYHLTYSLNESNDTEALDVVERGGNVAACVKYKGELPKTFTLKGIAIRTHNADEHDYRVIDPKFSIAVLAPKGRAKLPQFEGGFTRLA